MGTLQNLTGQVFGRLTVMYRSRDHIPPSGRPQVRWRCRCECGNEVDVLANALRKGTTKSCGCYHRERASEKGKLRVVDLTCQVFGQLTVLYRVYDYIDNSGHHSAKWRCRCECGNEIEVISGNLKKGNTKSCGCYVRLRNRIDLTGCVIGRLTVLHRAVDRINPNGYHEIQWHCRCECGNEVDVREKSLRSKNYQTRSCGCLQRERASELGRNTLIDLIGKQYGRLTVIGRATNTVSQAGNKKIKWHCKCECGKEIDVSATHLRSGHTQSCGCLQVIPVNFIDITGQRFGRLIVIGRAGRKLFATGQLTTWHCRCDCGNEIDVTLSNLKNGNTKSCGCMKSWMEYYVLEYCNSKCPNSGVEYEYQKRFDDLTGTGGRKLSYDFLIYQNGKPYCFIECQGEQHLRPVDYFGGKNKFEIQRMHDDLKREYARKMGIPIVEIPYIANSYEKVAEILKQAGI